MRRVSLLAVSALLFVACGDDDADNCTVVDNGDGSYSVTCGDETVVLSDGTDGTNGTDGVDGDDCTVADNGDGTYDVTCGDATVVLADGADGTDGTNGVDGDDCSVVDNGDGTFEVTCGDETVTLSNGSDGLDGDGCTVVDNGDGSFDVTCGVDTVTLNDPSYLPAEYLAADGIAGGVAYSQWWVTQAGGDGTLGDYSVTTNAEFSRCKTCHAWDGLGNAASYANRTGTSTGAAGRPDVSSIDLRASVATLTPIELFDAIQNPGGRDVNVTGNGHPDYSALLTDAQVWNIVKFMREEWIMPEELYRLSVDGPPVYWDGAAVSPSLHFFGIGAGGDEVNGDTIYAATCAACHGADGTSISLGGASLGGFLRSKPHELWFKVKFGQISSSSDEAMEPGLLTDTANLRDLYRALTDVTAYP